MVNPNILGHLLLLGDGVFLVLGDRSRAVGRSIQCVLLHHITSSSGLVGLVGGQDILLLVDVTELPVLKGGKT